MTETMTKSSDTDTSKKDTTAQDVIDFLRKNPKFLQQNPQAVDLLHPPAAKEKGVADFQSFMIQRLKADKDEVIRSTRVLVENARSNMTNQQRIYACVLRLLEARRFDDFIQSVTMDVASIMGVDISVLLVENDGGDVPHITTSGIRILPAGTIDKWMEGQNILLQDDIAGIEAIYGGGAALVKSQILLRLNIAPGTPPALLAFGSRDPDMFTEGQATDQIQFLTGVIERCFFRWLRSSN